MIEKLKQKFDSLTKVFEILYVIENVKPVARIMVKEENYKDIKEFLNKLKLNVDKADFKVLKEEKNPYSNKGEKIKLSDKRKGHYFIYISKKKEIIKKAKTYENSDDHISLGLTLGYPKCCCEFFNKYNEKQEEKFNDYILPALDNSNGFIFPFYNNYAARYFDLTLLSHFPCNFNCKESEKLAKKHLEVINKYSSEYASILRGMLKGAVIYTENYGVFLLRDSKIKNNKITYNSIIRNHNNKLFDLLRTNDTIEVINKNHIKVGKENIKTKNIGIMFFI